MLRSNRIVVVGSVLPLLLLASACGADGGTAAPHAATTGTAGSGPASGGQGGVGQSLASGAGMTSTSGGQGGLGNGAQGGTSTGIGGSTGSAGTTEPLEANLPVLVTLGEPCTKAGDKGCAGVGKPSTLICGSSLTWEEGSKCGGTYRCDPRPGPTLGTCQEQSPDCAVAGPLSPTCTFATVYTCRANGMESVKTRVCETGTCEKGKCLEPTGCPGSPWKVISCTGECGTTTDGSCGTDANNLLSLPDLTTLDLVLHVGYQNGLDPATMAIACPKTATTRLVKFSIPNTYGARVRTMVAPPWRVKNGYNATCDYSGAAQCTNGNPVWLYTDDPNAPDANVHIERISGNVLLPCN